MTGVRVALNYSYKTVSSRKTIPPPHPAAVGCVRAYLCVESMHATRHRYECESESHGDQRRMCKKKLHTRRTVGKEMGDRRARWSEGECIALPEGLKTLNERSAASGKIRGSTHTHQRKSVQRESKSAASPWQDIQRGKKKNNTKPKRTYINIAGKWMAWVGARGRGS